MSSPPNFHVVPFVRPSVRPFVRSDLVTTTSHEWLENNFDKSDREYSPAPTDDMIRFWRSKVKGQGHSRP